MKFIADGMLGKLTRWLRMLGQDVKYSKSLDDKRLIEIAKKKHYTILTRDLKLYQQAIMQGVNVVLVEATTGAEKLADLARRFNFKLEINVNISRCPKCNTKLEPVPKELVTDKVPKTTSTYYTEFWTCQGCGQVYWQGAHWKRIEKTLEKAQQALEKL